MKNQKGYTVVELIAVPGIIVALLLGTGWCMNIYKAFHLDFESPYKAEVIRVVGGVVPPVGGIAGWVTFEEEE